MIKETLTLAAEAFNEIFASTHPYREDGTSTLSDNSVELSNKAIDAIKESLAALVQKSLTDEMLARIIKDHMNIQMNLAGIRHDIGALTTLPAAPKQWVGLTYEEVCEWAPELQFHVRAVETKLKEKNT